MDMAEKKSSSGKIIGVIVVIAVLVVLGLVVKNSVTEGIIAQKIEEAKTALPNLVELEYGSIECAGLGFATCSINNIKITETSKSMTIDSVSFTENPSLARFGMANMSNTIFEAEGSMNMVANINGIEVHDAGKSLLPPMDMTKDVEVTLKNGMPTYLKINAHDIKTSLFEITLSGEFTDISYEKGMPTDMKLEYVSIEGQNKDLQNILNIAPMPFGEQTKTYVHALLSGQEKFFMESALEFEEGKQKELLQTANSFAAKKPIKLTIKNKSGIKASTLAAKLPKIAPGDEGKLFSFLGENFTLTTSK